MFIFYSAFTSVFYYYYLLEKKNILFSVQFSFFRFSCKFVHLTYYVLFPITFVTIFVANKIVMRIKSNYLFHHLRHSKRKSCFECRCFDAMFLNSCRLFNLPVSSGYVMKCFVPHYDSAFKPIYKQLNLFDYV